VTRAGWGRALALVGLALSLLSASACRRNRSSAPPKPRLGSVTTEDLTPPDDVPARLDLQGFERELREHLLASGLFDTSGSGGAGGPAATDGKTPISRVRASVAIQSAEVGAKGEARVRIRIALDSRPTGAPGALAFTLEGQGAEGYEVGALKPGAPKPDRSATFDALALRVASDLLSGFVARQRLHDGPPAAVHAALISESGDAGDLREEAIRVVAERQLRDEVPALLKLLGDSEENIRDAALGALITLRDRRAVTELTRTRSLRDRREMRKIIEAIGILGGQEADEYLSFVAATHDDDEIRGEAAAARTRLLRREQEAGEGRN
jgi:hypothetical protein